LTIAAMEHPSRHFEKVAEEEASQAGDVDAKRQFDQKMHDAAGMRVTPDFPAA
jgi:hypothetical protein